MRLNLHRDRLLRDNSDMELPFDIQDASPSVQAHYRKMVEAGQSPRFAEMIALGVAPAVRGSDRGFMEGQMNNEQLDDMPKIQAQKMAAAAKAAGINISGKRYISGLADRKLKWRDPEAWVGGIDDMKRVAAKRRLHLTGAVEYTPHEAPPPQRILLGEDIIKRRMVEYRKQFPKKKKAELREMIIAKHAYKPEVKTV